MKLVIVLCGRKRAGKTTLANWFHASYGAKVISITDPLREITRRIWRLTEEQVNGAQKDQVLAEHPSPIEHTAIGHVLNNMKATPRDLMLHTSKAIKAVLGDDVWIDHAVHKVDEAFEEHKLVVVDGVRPHNEVDSLRDLALHPCESDHAANWQRKVIVVKVVCTDDQPADNEDEIDREIDLIEPDFVIKAPRDEAGLGRTLMHEATFEVLELLSRQPDLIEIFDPGGPDDDEAAAS